MSSVQQQMRHVQQAKQKQGLKQVKSNTVQKTQVVQTPVQNVVDPTAIVMTEEGQQMSAKKALQQLGPSAPVTVQNAQVQAGASVQVPLSTPTVQKQVDQQLLATSQEPTQGLKAVPQQAVAQHQPVIVAANQVTDLDAPIVPIGADEPIPLQQAIKAGMPQDHPVVTQNAHVQPGTQVLTAQGGQQQGKRQSVVKQMQQAVQPAQMRQAGQKVKAQTVPDAAVVLAKIGDVDDLNAKVLLQGQTLPTTLQKALEKGVSLNTQVAVQAKNVQDAAKVQLPSATQSAQPVQTQTGKNGTNAQLEHVAYLPASQLATVQTSQVAPEQVVQAQLGHVQPGATVAVQGVQGTMTTQQAQQVGVPLDADVGVLNAEVPNPQVQVKVPQSAPRIQQSTIAQSPSQNADVLRQVAQESPEALDTAVSHQLNPQTQVVAHLDAVNPQAQVLTLDGKQVTAQKAQQKQQQHAITSAENVLPETPVQVLPSAVRQTIPVLAQAVPAKQQVIAPVDRVQQKAQVKTQDGQTMSAFKANILNPLQSVFALAGNVKQNTIVQVPVDMAGNPLASANQQRQQAANRITGSNFASRFMSDLF
jgi:hypothetical protein